MALAQSGETEAPAAGARALALARDTRSPARHGRARVGQHPPDFRVGLAEPLLHDGQVALRFLDAAGTSVEPHEPQADEGDDDPLGTGACQARARAGARSGSGRRGRRSGAGRGRTRGSLLARGGRRQSSMSRAGPEQTKGAASPLPPVPACLAALGGAGARSGPLRPEFLVSFEMPFAPAPRTDLREGDMVPQGDLYRHREALSVGPAIERCEPVSTRVGRRQRQRSRAAAAHPHRSDAEVLPDRERAARELDQERYPATDVVVAPAREPRTASARSRSPIAHAPASTKSASRDR